MRYLEKEKGYQSRSGRRFAAAAAAFIQYQSTHRRHSAGGINMMTAYIICLLSGTTAE